MLILKVTQSAVLNMPRCAVWYLVQAQVNSFLPLWRDGEAKTFPKRKNIYFKRFVGYHFGRNVSPFRLKGYICFGKPLGGLLLLLFLLRKKKTAALR